jgi:predicted Ser/Thr protein kinase
VSVLTERLRRALAAEYDVEDEIASGGMGVVYRARDRALERLVAIKIIRPDLATADATERFLREARALASFNHPNIVPVHRAGESQGLAFYVMDYLDGDTLADRLARGPLPGAEALRLADDLLAALEAVHAHGIVHRDVKPHNIFLAGGRAILGDFGVAKTTTPDAPALTAPGHVVGTPGYMPPEQLAGGDVTPRADIGAAGMVIFEAFTGRQWTFDSHTERADWSGVPPAAVPALRRALAWAPAERWESAADFRRALGGPAQVTTRRVLAWAGGALVLAAAIATWRLWPAPPAGAVRVQIQPLAAQDGASSGFADSLTAQLLYALRGAADIDFQLAPGPPQADITIEGGVRLVSDTAHVTFRAAGAGRGGTLFEDRAAAPRATAGDVAAHHLLRAIWNSRNSAFRDLPVEALPRSTTGLTMWAQAEALYARGQWAEAFKAYEDAARTDTSCALCELRLVTVTRWLRNSPDTALTHRLARSIDAFTPQYQEVIRAGTDSVNRWEALRQMVERSPRFDLGHFIYGDEQFHRGPLAGFNRALAMDEFKAVVALRPHFAPALEHLAWVAIAEGDSAAAEQALRQYDTEAAPDDIETRIKQALLHVGFAWRFLPGEAAVGLTSYALAQPMIAGFADLRWGGSYMLVFDAPEGVVWLGRRFAEWPGRPDLHAQGLIAQIVGYQALGRLDSAQAVTQRLRGESADPEYALVAAEFEAMRVLFDSLDARAAWPRLQAALGPIARMDAATPTQRRRAAWMLALLARRAHLDERTWPGLVAGEPMPAPFATLLEADTLARLHPRRAIERTHRLLALDSANRAGDPFFRSALHLLRADWHLRDGDSSSAARDLLWYGNYDIVGQPSAPVQAEDADWALGTLARWRRAQIAPNANGRELCRDLADVARLWKNADPRYRVRGDSARTRHQALGCGA